MDLHAQGLDIYARYLGKVIRKSLAWSSEFISRNISSMSQTAHEDLESANNAGVCYLSF